MMLIKFTSVGVRMCRMEESFLAAADIYRDSGVC